MNFSFGFLSKRPFLRSWPLPLLVDEAMVMLMFIVELLLCLKMDLRLFRVFETYRLKVLILADSGRPDSFTQLN